ncbi:MAG: TolC family protein [Bacteroidales bacterium]|nr:TolC family protein [Bacteroidales bacterium]MBN2819913.1 TolC family protein [Bacteroidales bacterium]
MRRALTIIIFGVLVLVNGNSQEQLSLSDAIQIGLKNNYDLQITRNKEKISDINNTWGNTSIMPSLDFSLTGRENLNINSNEDYRTQTIKPDLNLSWVLFDGFSAVISKQKFEELEKQSQGNTAIMVELTIQDIILAYNNCLLQKDLLLVYKELAALSEDRYNRSIYSKELGVGTTYEGLQAKTSWLEDQANFLQQKNNYENSVRTLNFILSVEDNSNWDFISELTTETPDYNIDDLSAKLMHSNSNLKNQYIYQTILAKETELARSNYYPSVRLGTGLSNTDMGNFYSGTSADITQNFSDVYVGLTLSWNIFNGGTRQRSIQIAKINEESAQVQTGQMEHSLKNQLLQLYSNYNVNKTLFDLAKEKEVTAKLNLDLSADKLKNGTINSFNYRDVQIQYMNAAISKMKAIYNLISSNTDLLRITGGILEEYEQELAD